MQREHQHLRPPLQRADILGGPGTTSGHLSEAQLGLELGNHSYQPHDLFWIGWCLFQIRPTQSSVGRPGSSRCDLRLCRALTPPVSPKSSRRFLAKTPALQLYQPWPLPSAPPISDLSPTKSQQDDAVGRDHSDLGPRRGEEGRGLSLLVVITVVTQVALYKSHFRF
eukprot:XP_008768104.1 PREDICTED: uncharacterized protein LOC102555308 isoform X2 [Rattus norvegicus]